MEQNQSDDPIKSPVIQEIIMSNRIGAIAVELAKRLDIAPEKALQLFYESQTCADLHDKTTGLYLYGDLYVADEFMREKGEEGWGFMATYSGCSLLVTEGYTWMEVSRPSKAHSASLPLNYFYATIIAIYGCY